MQSKWEKFTKELANLSFFWFFGVCFFLIFRISFIAIFSKQLSSAANLPEILKVLLMGFRFDCTAVSYFVIIPFLLLLALGRFGKTQPARIARIVCQYIFVLLSTVICFVTLNYFGEYHNQFNNFLFLGLYDDQKAVLHTIMEDFHPWRNLIGMLLTIIASLLILRYFEPKTFIYNQLRQLKFKNHAAVVVIVSLILMIFSLRGSVTSVPALRKWAGVSKDAFLNKTVINPYRSLIYAMEDFDEINLLSDVNPYMDEVSFKANFNQPLVTDYLKKTAAGTSTQKPKQIFLVIMESYDSWPLMDKYQPFLLSTQLCKIKNNGTHFSHFLPAADATFDSFGAIVTNVPYCGVNISKIGQVNDPFATSLFGQFNKLNYQTNLFYGGFSSWQNIEEFSKYQGVQRFFSATDAGGNSESGTWGVEDEKLFDLVLSKTDAQKESLNVILTSSYHAPYTVDVAQKGFPYTSEKDFPASVQKYFDGSMTMEEVGHLWYGDYAIGKFIEKAKQKYPDAVFLFTGDHFGRRFINSHPNLYERSSVGLVMYGKNIPQAKPHTAGSHIDIMPTLIEMVAPKGFEYYSFGTSMYAPHKDLSITFNKMVTQNQMYCLPKDAAVESIDLNTMQEKSLPSTPLKKDYNQQMALAWFYTMKGNQLQKKTKK